MFNSLSFLNFALLLLVMPATSAPVGAIQQGSKHSLYLATCTRRSLLGDCPLIILCARQQRNPYTAVAYYANGPIESNRNTNPTQLTTVNQPAKPWEGTTRTAKITRTGDFSSNIDAAAETLAKGQIAGTAKLGSEDFVCFKDGETSINVGSALDLDDGRVSCTADYWCPSIEV